MGRAYCYQCHRAKISCLCGRIEKQPNKLKVYVLQHPDETDNPKGSVIIAELGLKQYQRWVGEDFRQHEGLNKLLREKGDNIALLYPSENAGVLGKEGANIAARDTSCLLIIDGTWRKARKIWKSNPQLHDLSTYRLADGKLSDYRIRKAPKDGYLSTIECIVEGLRALEECPEAYQPLLDLFTEMIDYQIEKMGNKTYSSNYLHKN